ncbi:unnamed protein product [Eruca vesicaria subsp. sativa]|uniref:IP5PC-F immunoglobulin-like domain-containing protein n=1 Tax=Eruca vesicaria subsp. sativa TaxID=29727 RepID=A0ABC8JKC1_ERUVS|nr:unnamed protein product [Eruca vesicaria subsp. sativa]
MRTSSNTSRNSFSPSADIALRRAIFNILCKRAGMLKPDASVQVKVLHEDFLKLDESFDGIQQNLSREETCDKEVTLVINIQGSCSTRTTSHSIKVCYCFSAAKSLSLPYPHPPA